MTLPTASVAQSPLARFHQIITKHQVGVWIVGAVIILLVLVAVSSRISSAQTQQQTQQSADVAQSKLDKVAAPVAAQCAADPSVRRQLGDDVCAAAKSAAAVPGPAGPMGAPGSQGAEGRGIVATVIRADGHLVVTYTDGAKVDVGTVVGQAGPNGRGIASSAVVDGRLILTFSDGATQDLGAIVGEKGTTGTPGALGAAGTPGQNGRGISGTAIVDDRLIVTYDDGTTTDAGQVPAGPAGVDGRDGSPAVSLTITRTDGTTVVCDRSGGDDTSPAYTCRAS